MNRETVYSQQQILRERLLDSGNAVSNASARDLVAHLLLYLHDPLRVGDIAVQWLQERMEAERVDGSFGSPSDAIFACGQWESASTKFGVPSTRGTTIVNSHPIMQLAWELPFPMAIDSIQNEPAFNSEMRSALLATGTRSKMITPLRGRNGKPFALINVDRTSRVRRSWSSAQIDNYRVVVHEVIAPILETAKLLSDETAVPEGQLFDRAAQLTVAEMRVAKLAARGLGYKEIARLLDRSVHTIDHQLRSIRHKLGIVTHAKLVEFLAHPHDAEAR